MSKKNSDQNPVIGTILAVLVLIVGVAVYAITGVDFLGVVDDGTPPPAEITSVAPTASGNVQTISFENGVGYEKAFWEVYFTRPVDTRDRSQWDNGVDTQIAAAIDGVQNTLDIAAFEFASEAITEAVIAAHERGVRVRVVTDDEHGIEDDDSTIIELEAYDIPIVDDDRTGLMHNKFLILDGITVWTGSTNLTPNGSYRNNNNMLSIRSRRAVQIYQAEFNEMFVNREFGITSDPSNGGMLTQDGIPMEIYFASENPVVTQIIDELNNAQRNIRFMAFSYTRDDMGMAMLEAANRGVDVAGVFETVGSETRFSEMTRLHCAGLDVRQDGYPGILHHKVIVIDESIVITGSFNFSNNAVESNDENLVIIRDPDMAALYLQEFQRVQSVGSRPTADDVTCD